MFVKFKYVLRFGKKTIKMVYQYSLKKSIYHMGDCSSKDANEQCVINNIIKKILTQDTKGHNSKVLSDKGKSGVD